MAVVAAAVVAAAALLWLAFVLPLLEEFEIEDDDNECPLVRYGLLMIADPEYVRCGWAAVLLPAEVTVAVLDVAVSVAVVGGGSGAGGGADAAVVIVLEEEDVFWYGFPIHWGPALATVLVLEAVLFIHADRAVLCAGAGGAVYDCAFLDAMVLE
jgi:hypothetical protein